jgi:hypothetical protein
MRPAEALGAINQTETRHDCDYIMYHRLLCINWLISSGLDKTAWHYLITLTITEPSNPRPIFAIIVMVNYLGLD